MKQLIKIIFFLLISNAVSACIIDQLVAETNNGVNWPTANPTWGQSFVACDNGDVWEIAFWPQWTTTGLHTLILTDINCVTMWTVNNINITSSGNQIIADLATGSGSSRAVTSGTSYIFQLIGPAGSNLQLNLSWTDPYPAGEDKTDGCSSYTLDWWFRVSIDEPLGALPVELSAFDAALIEKGTAVELNFKTASELGASHFGIEHSTNGRSYQNIGTVKAAGTSSESQSYRFVHQNPQAGNNYYRLKQVDFDGHFEYSKIVQVLVASTQVNFRISPNPTSDALYVFFDKPVENKISIDLISLDGRRLQHQILRAGVKQSSIDCNRLPAGIYLLKVMENGIPVRIEKVVKQ